MIPNQFDAIKIIKGELIYPVEKFITDIKRILNYEYHDALGKEQLDMKFNGMILGMAFESEEESLFLDYSNNKIPAYNFIEDENNNSIPDLFNLAHASKWELYDCEFKLFASFIVLKLSQNFDLGTEDPKAQEIIANFKKSYEAFREDWYEKLSYLIQLQKEEIENDFKNLQS